MFELKEGRGPSFMGGIASLVMVGFAVCWVGLCVSIGAPIWFTMFGALFGVLGLVSAVYNFWAATTRNRPDLRRDDRQGRARSAQPPTKPLSKGAPDRIFTAHPRTNPCESWAW